MINWPLLRWEMRNIRWWYAGLFIFLFIGAFSLLLFATTGGPVNWGKMDFFLFGAYWALFGGMANVSSKLKKGTMAFLLARPVSRREMYHAMALAGGLPIIILIMSPVLFALILSPWLASSMSLGQLLLLDVLRAVWLTALFLLAILTSLYTGDYRNKFYSILTGSFIIAVTIAWTTTIGIINKRALVQWLFQHHPGLSLLLSLALCCLFYYLGRRRLERMDIQA
ncbi:hypothetical protein [Desulfotomaculum copahuensis]|uniref:Uncharacterized protein n=1 Tax=Desulfotomaculum copahuensis TaxID=1838280 RepID=A0A1B7LAJ3_9FIRM|nr:hypothetical protein [Desulfotomaculum copahuensis]OAT79348.1 hypothetical protein A6M21_15970 [Desulfotomaculum copahuensis]